MAMKKSKKYEEGLTQKFQPSWKKEFPWIALNNEKKEMLQISDGDR